MPQSQRARASRDEDIGSVSIRAAAPADQVDIDRLFHDGLLPGHVDDGSRARGRMKQIADRQRGRFLVAESGGRVVGTIAVMQSTRGVGHVQWLRVDPGWQAGLKVARRLARAAAEYAREAGFLKLAMHAPADVEDEIAAFYRRLGFVYSRTREVQGVHVLEFYVNLYEKRKPERESVS